MAFRRNKYGAIRTTRDGITFDSKAEADRWMDLRLLQSIGEIRDLERQPRYDITIEGVFCGFYKADFSYRARGDGAWPLVIEDVKGRDTPVSALKRKLIFALYGIDVQIVGKAARKSSRKPAKKKGRSRANEPAQATAT